LRALGSTLVAGLFVVALGCGGDSSEPNQNAGAGSVSTTINGVGFSASTTVQASLAGGLLTIGATQTTGGSVRSLSVAVQSAAVGVFETGAGSPTVVSYSEGTGPGLQTWTSGLASTPGSVRISVLTATRAAGEFVSVPLQSASGGVRALSGGTFDVKLGTSY
jgi:hypothetical protein